MWYPIITVTHVQRTRHVGNEVVVWNFGKKNRLFRLHRLTALSWSGEIRVWYKSRQGFPDRGYPLTRYLTTPKS